MTAFHEYRCFVFRTPGWFVNRLKYSIFKISHSSAVMHTRMFLEGLSSLPIDDCCLLPWPESTCCCIWDLLSSSGFSDLLGVSVFYNRILRLLLSFSCFLFWFPKDCYNQVQSYEMEMAAIFKSLYECISPTILMFGSTRFALAWYPLPSVITGWFLFPR